MRREEGAQFADDVGEKKEPLTKQLVVIKVSGKVKKLITPTGAGAPLVEVQHRNTF